MAYAVRHARRETAREIARCLAIAGGIGAACLVARWLIHPPGLHQGPGVLLVGLASFLTYVPALFVVEEVFFRGALDTHLYPGPNRTRGPWASAIVVSLLWAIWRLPMLPAPGLGPLVVFEIFVSTLIVGVPLSFGWRRSGNLLAPVIAHAAVDALRNVLGVAPR